MAIAAELRQEAVEAFHAYEKVLIGRIVRKPGWRMDAAPLHAVLQTDDEERVREFIADLNNGRQGLLDAVIAT